MDTEPETFGFILAHMTELDKYIAVEVEKGRKSAKGGKRRLSTAKSRHPQEDSD